MAVVASATGAAVFGLSGVAAGLAGGALLGAGAGALYSGITGDGNILNSALTGGLLGATAGGLGAAFAPAAAGTAAGTTAGATTPALAAAKGAGGTMGGISAGGAFTPSAASAANFSLPSLSSTALMGPTYKELGVNAISTMTGPQKLAAGLAGTAALSYVGGQNQPTLQQDPESPSYIRPYTYGQKRNPNYGAPGESYFTQSYTAGEPYEAAKGGIMRMADGGVAQPIVPMQQLAAPVTTYGAQRPVSQAVTDYNKLIAERAQNEYNVQPAPLSTLPGGGERATEADTRKIINQYYLSNLGRQGEQEGLDYWTQQKMNTGATLGDISKQIKGSNEGQVFSAYKDLLGRNPDAGGAEYYQGLLASGTPMADIRNSIMGSQEYLSRPASAQPTAKPGQTGYTYDPVTKQFTAPTAPVVDAAAQDNGFMGMDPNVLQQMYNQYQQQQQSLQGGKRGGLMPNNLRYANGGEAIDSDKERMQMMNLIKNRIQESSQGPINFQDPSQMQDQRNQLEFMMRNNPNFAASMSPPLQGMIEGAQYGDRMSKSYGGQPRDFNVMPTTVDPTTGSYGGIASIGKQIDPKTRINAMANLYRSPYDKNATDAVRRLGGGISRQIGKDANLSAYYEQDPMGRSKSGGVRYSQNFNQGGDIQGYNLGGYSDGGRLLRGPGDGVSDNIPAVIGDRQPARLADGEFVIPARIVSELGNGSTDAGAKRLYAMMDKIQAGRKKTVGKGNVAKDTKAKKHLLA
jgi:hypothetical protein